jgi:hypothetical protein
VCSGVTLPCSQRRRTSQGCIPDLHPQLTCIVAFCDQAQLGFEYLLTYTRPPALVRERGALTLPPNQNYASTHTAAESFPSFAIGETTVTMTDLSTTPVILPPDGTKSNFVDPSTS